MTGLDDLPDELWLDITSRLYLPHLQDFANSCQRAKRNSATAVAEHRHLQANWRYHVLDARKTSRWYEFLVTVLRFEAVACYIETLEEGYDNSHYDFKSHTFSLVRAPTGERKLIECAIESCPFIVGEEKQIFRSGILKQHESQLEYQKAVISLALLQLPNLKRFGPSTPQWIIRGEQWFKRPITRVAQAAASHPLDPNADSVPLSKLEHVKIRRPDTFSRGDLESLAPFMALPSMRRIDAQDNGEMGFEWPIDLPKSKVRIINLPRSMVKSDAIKRLGHGLVGPCIVHQTWDYKCRDRILNPKVHFSSFEVLFEGAKEEDWVLKMLVPTPEE